MTAQDVVLAFHGASVVEATLEYVLVKIPLCPGAQQASIDNPPFSTLELDGKFVLQSPPADSLEKARLAGMSIADWFEKEFWPLYPRKVGKGAARTAAVRKAKTPEIRAAIIRGLQRQLPGMSEKEQEYIPHPATWLNQERWNDEIASPCTMKRSVSKQESIVDDIRNRYQREGDGTE